MCPVKPLIYLLFHRRLNLQKFVDHLPMFSGIKVIIDFVPNHTSNESEWFQRSINAKDDTDPYWDFYIWNTGKRYPNGTREPPNNWVSIKWLNSIIITILIETICSVYVQVVYSLSTPPRMRSNVLGLKIKFSSDFSKNKYANLSNLINIKYKMNILVKQG